MIDFESYVKSNWSVPESTSCGIKYSHSSRECLGRSPREQSSFDKKSNRILINHTVNLTITWFDKDNNQLRTEKLSFVNDDMNKSFDKKMLIINRQELINKFRVAKPQIVHKMITEKNDKLIKINDEIDSLRSYLGRKDDVIPHEMKNTIEISDSSKARSRTDGSELKRKENSDKTHFDM